MRQFALLFLGFSIPQAITHGAYAAAVAITLAVVLLLADLVVASRSEGQ